MIIIFINWPPIIDSTFFFDFFLLKIVEHCWTINFQKIHKLLKIHIWYSILNIRERYKADNFPNKSHMNFTKYSKQINIYSYIRTYIYCVKHKSQKPKVKSQKSKAKSQKSKAQLSSQLSTLNSIPNSQLSTQLSTLSSQLSSQLSTQLNSQLSTQLSTLVKPFTLHSI